MMATTINSHFATPRFGNGSPEEAVRASQLILVDPDSGRDVGVIKARSGGGLTFTDASDPNTHHLLSYFA